MIYTLVTGAPMNTNNKLQELTQEVLSFSDVINYAEDLTDSDFRQTCTLFSQYMGYQLDQINPNTVHSPSTSQLTTSQLYQLNELITPVDSDFEDPSRWSNRLHNFCNNIQSLRHIAA